MLALSISQTVPIGAPTPLSWLHIQSREREQLSHQRGRPGSCQEPGSRWSASFRQGLALMPRGTRHHWEKSGLSEGISRAFTPSRLAESGFSQAGVQDSHSQAHAEAAEEQSVDRGPDRGPSHDWPSHPSRAQGKSTCLSIPAHRGDWPAVLPLRLELYAAGPGHWS